MSATILHFPSPGKAKPRPASVADLNSGAKALAITQVGARFLVSIRPAVTSAERAVQRHFPNAEQARAFARQMAISYPRLYQLILDEVPHRLPRANDRPPFDGGAAA